MLDVENGGSRRKLGKKKNVKKKKRKKEEKRTAKAPVKGMVVAVVGAERCPSEPGTISVRWKTVERLSTPALQVVPGPSQRALHRGRR